MSYFVSLITWFWSHVGNFIFSTIVALVGYFSPIKNIEHVMIAAIVVDLFIGLWASKKQGIGWKSMKLWRTVYKMFFAVVIVMLLYSMDIEMGFSWLKTHKLAAWLITGFEIWSILENAAKISNHKVFRLLKNLMEDKIKKETGVDITKKY